MRLGVVTGLEREARCLSLLSGGPAHVRCLGMGPQAAATAATELLRDGCGALLSFGLCGGLHPGLSPGQAIAAPAVVDPSGTLWRVDAGWRERLVRLLPGCAPATDGLLFGSDRPLLDAAAKRTFGARFGAIAVDMESHAVARVAARAGVPFLSLRVVVDAAGTCIPPCIPRSIDEHGKPRVAALLAALAFSPAELGALLRLARDQRTAMARLRRVALDLGPLFALA